MKIIIEGDGKETREYENVQSFILTGIGSPDGINAQRFTSWDVQDAYDAIGWLDVMKIRLLIERLKHDNTQ